MKNNEVPSHDNLCKTVRFLYDMTQAEFSKEFGIPLRTVQGWESRKTMPVYIYNILMQLLELKTKEETYKNLCHDLLRK